MTVVLGIDIGVTGAIAAVDSYGAAQIADIPMIDIPGKRMVRRRIDARGLMLLVRQFVPAGQQALAMIEDIHTMPGAGNSPQSQGSLMHSLGVVQTVLEIARLDIASVSPQTWKRHFGLIDPKLNPSQRKRKSLECARRLYPQCNEIARAKDHNRSEALLIAHHLS